LVLQADGVGLEVLNSEGVVHTLGAAATVRVESSLGVSWRMMSISARIILRVGSMVIATSVGWSLR